MKIYVIESGDYEQRGVDGVATSPLAARNILVATGILYGGKESDVSEPVEDPKNPDHWKIHRDYGLGAVCVYELTPYEADQVSQCHLQKTPG